MTKIRIIDTEGKDEVHTVVKAIFVEDKLWMYTTTLQYYIPVNTITFMQIWKDMEGNTK